MVPGKGRQVSIIASGSLPDGQKISTKTTFRIKDIPSPTGSVLGQTGRIKLPKSNIAVAKVEGILQDFDFDLTLQTLSFKFKAPGQPTVNVTGNRMNDRAKSALKRVKSGQTVEFFDIKVRNPKNPSYQFKKVSPVFIEVAN